jgi:hypothetical protein
MASLGRAGLESLPDTAVITRERKMIETYFLHIKISRGERGTTDEGHNGRSSIVL